MAVDFIDTDALQGRLVGLMRAANVANAGRSDPAKRVYDDVPMAVTTQVDRETGSSAYVEIAAALETEDDTTDAAGTQHIATLNVFSEHKGFKEARQVARRIRAALHRVTFDLSGMHVLNWVDDVQYTVAADGVTRQAVIRIRSICRT